MKVPKIVKVLIPLFILVLLASGCSKDSSQTKSGQENQAKTPAETTDIAVYYLKSSETEFFLVREVHKVEKTPKMAEAAVNELIKGTPATAGAARVLPPNTRVLGVKIDQGLATVDFSSEVLRANVGSEGEALGIASIVNTLTEFPSIKKVSFTVEGQVEKAQDWWGHVGLSEQPFSRNLAVVNEPAIWVTAPTAGQIITSPVEIEGTARVFEATVSFRLKDSQGKVIAQDCTNASEGAPGRGDFQYKLPFKAPSPGKGQLEVYWASPKDGSDLDKVIIPVEWK